MQEPAATLLLDTDPTEPRIQRQAQQRHGLAATDADVRSQASAVHPRMHLSSLHRVLWAAIAAGDVHRLAVGASQRLEAFQELRAHLVPAAAAAAGELLAAEIGVAAPFDVHFDATPFDFS